MTILFTYEFDELPLIRDGEGIIAPVSGEAEIAVYDAEGKWFIRSIRLHRYETGKPTSLYEIEDRVSWLYTTIWGELNADRHAEQISERVRNELAELGVSIPTDWQEHSTHVGKP
jgi:hypothetical protein